MEVEDMGVIFLLYKTSVIIESHKKNGNDSNDVRIRKSLRFFVNILL